MVGITKLDGITLEELRRPRKKLEEPLTEIDTQDSAPVPA